MCSTRSNAFEASKNTACTDEPWVIKYGAVLGYKVIKYEAVLGYKPWVIKYEAIFCYIRKTETRTDLCEVHIISIIIPI